MKRQETMAKSIAEMMEDISTYKRLNICEYKSDGEVCCFSFTEEQRTKLTKAYDALKELMIVFEE